MKKNCEYPNNTPYELPIHVVHIGLSEFMVRSWNNTVAVLKAREVLTTGKAHKDVDFINREETLN